ncbi:MAG: MerR family transcriptional regulator [Anaerolineae bacterium]|jgi:DNA-binding transcriptional MerR regulator
MAEQSYLLPHEVASELDVSPSTLRRWSNEFADHLSDSAGRPQPELGSKTAHRRYTEDDLATLETIKDLLADGLTYVQVARRLEARQPEILGPEGEPVPGRALSTGTPEAAYAPAASVLADTIHSVSEGQQLLLGSQQANRELLSVVLQDNFSLKEENAKLRNRMLELERDMTEIRRLDDARRQNLEVRLQRLEDHARRLAAQPPVTERPGCLAQIFGPLT